MAFARGESSLPSLARDEGWKFQLRTEIDPAAPTIELGTIVQKGGKVVHGWAIEGDLDPAAAVSNTFELAWPPGTGLRQLFPEIDRVEWFDMEEARRRIKETQIPLIDRLEEALG